MAKHKPKNLIIPFDEFIFRIAWYESRGQSHAGKVLRLLAAEGRPAYEVDESLVDAKVAELRQRIEIDDETNSNDGHATI